MTFQKENELRELLLPYIHTFPERKYDVEKEDVEGLIRFASRFKVLDMVLEEAKRHSGNGEENQPNAFWNFLKLIPDGVPPGEELSADDEDV